MTNVRDVLRAYQINPSEIVPVTKRLYKVTANNYSYALKHSRLQWQSLSNWYSVYQIAREHQLNTILPVYMAQNGEIIQQHANDIYYLTPWLSNKETDEPEHEMESFYRSIAVIHNQTKKKIPIQLEQLEFIISREKEKTNQYRDKLLSYVERFEQRHYMSPFELRVCMQYRDIDYVVRQLNNWYDYYLEDIKEDKVSYRSLCHGNLRSSHQIYQSSNTYLINWEHAYFGHPISDLARYYYDECKYHDCLLEKLIHAFSFYEKYNPLLQSERSLLAIHLLLPTNYFQVIEYYWSNNWRHPQPFQIKHLEQSYRRLMHGLAIQEYLHKVREQIQEEQEQKEQQAESD